jgi:hypothetical protein
VQKSFNKTKYIFKSLHLYFAIVAVFYPILVCILITICVFLLFPISKSLFISIEYTTLGSVCCLLKVAVGSMGVIIGGDGIIVGGVGVTVGGIGVTVGGIGVTTGGVALTGFVFSLSIVV